MRVNPYRAPEVEEAGNSADEAIAEDAEHP